VSARVGNVKNKDEGLIEREQPAKNVWRHGIDVGAFPIDAAIVARSVNSRQPWVPSLFRLTVFAKSQAQRRGSDGPAHLLRP